MADNEYYEYNAGNDQPEDEWPETVWDPNHSYQGTEDPYRTAQGPAGTYVPPAPLLNQNEILMASNPPSYDPCDATQRASLRRVFSDESRLQSQAIEPYRQGHCIDLLASFSGLFLSDSPTKVRKTLPRDRSISVNEATDRVRRYGVMIRFARYMGNASLEESQEVYRAHTRPEGSADMPSYQGYLPETYIGRRPPDTSTQTQQPTSGGGAAASHTFNTIPQHIWNHWHGWQTSAGLPEDAASANILNAYQTAFQHTGDPDCGSHPSIGPSITHAAHQWLNAQAAQAAQTAPLGASAAQVQAAPQGFSGKHVYGSLDHTDFDYDDDEAEDFD